jgi:spore coat polysaccharide biosynthesis predicted glycosyltransferase SpsG
MPELMSEADLAISAAGSTSWELVYMGVPSVLIPVAVNQDRIADGLDSAGAAVAVRDIDRLRDVFLVLARNGEERIRMARLGREIVDGLGSARVVEQLRATPNRL